MQTPGTSVGRINANGPRYRNVGANEAINSHDYGISSYEYKIGSRPQSFVGKFEDQPKVIDHLAKNFNMIGNNKNKEFEVSKRVIAAIYKDLNVVKYSNGEMSRFKNIRNFLSPQIKNRFLKHKDHKILTLQIQQLNEATVNFYDQIKCYKMDLAQSLQNLFECYNTIFINQYEIFGNTESEKEKSFTQ